MKTLREITDYYTLSSSYGYSIPQKNHLYNFKMSSYNVNNYHWEKHKGKGEHDATEEKKTKHLDAAINNNKTPEPLTVYSGIGYDPRKRMNKDGVVHHPAYLSTSLERESAKTFAAKNSTIDHENKTIHRHMLQIDVPQGHPSALVPHNTFEKELVLPRGMNLRHKKTDTNETTSPYGEKLIHYTHHMEIV